MEYVEPVLSALVTLAATFFGAYYAFSLHAKAEARARENDQVGAINRCQFQLMKNVNQLTNIRKQVIDPIRTDPARSISMRPSIFLAETATSTADDLAFLLETENRDLLCLVVFEQQKFENIMEAMKARSEMHAHEVQPRLDGLIRENQEYSSAAIHEILGDRIMISMARLTDDIIDMVDATISSTTDLSSKIRSAMKRRYPNVPIVSFHLDDGTTEPGPADDDATI